MSDRDRILAELRQAGRRGLHSHEIRHRGLSGNPAQRIAELRDRGHMIFGKLERRNGRNGKRWFLIRDAGRGAGVRENTSVASVPPGTAEGVRVGAHVTAPGMSPDPGQAPDSGGRATAAGRESARNLSGDSGQRATDGPAAPQRLFEPPPPPHDREAA